MDVIANHPMLSYVGLIVGSLLMIGLYHGLARMLARLRMDRLRVRLRKARLEVERALHDYPLYDPPHKVEEGRLPKEKAAENFDYFMRVRMKRVAQFREWLRQHFAVTVTLDEEGVRALGRWGNDYAGWLLVRRAEGLPQSSDTYYRTYYALRSAVDERECRHERLIRHGDHAGRINHCQLSEAALGFRPNLGDSSQNCQDAQTHTRPGFPTANADGLR